jgi:hypothetical protein
MEMYSVKPFHSDSTALDPFFCNLVCFVAFLRLRARRKCVQIGNTS